MNLAIFGATGKTGIELIKQALERNHKVTAFARSPQKISVKSKNLRIVKGDIRNQEDIDNVIKGKDAVLSVLGVKPLSKPVEDFAVKNIILAMKKNKVKRIVVESAYGVGETKKGIYPFLLWLALNKNLRAKERMEKYLEESNLDWTIVRPPILTNGKRTGKYHEGKKILKGFRTISRADVADFMLKAIEEKKFIHQKPVVSN